MSFFKNREVVRGVLGFSVVSVAATVAATVWNKNFGLFTLVLCVLFLVLYIVITRLRYARISAMAEDIDKLLHGKDSISFNRYEEGELAVLGNELGKMTVRLREQQQKLLQDKVFLANSIADVSHQIRTPLTSINLLVSFLEQPQLSRERRIELTRELFELLSKIDWLISTLLKMSRLDAGAIVFKKEKISLKSLIIKSVESLLVPMELREQELSIKAEGEFEGDILWTCEALINVLKNCMEHTPRGGKLKLVGYEGALFSEIIIADNGEGIAEEDLPHVFERFYKGRNSDTSSVGIGLALARMIITGQGGVIKVENKVSGGAMFTIRFYKGTI